MVVILLQDLGRCEGLQRNTVYLRSALDFTVEPSTREASRNTKYNCLLIKS